MVALEAVVLASSRPGLMVAYDGVMATFCFAAATPPLLGVPKDGRFTRDNSK